MSTQNVRSDTTTETSRKPTIFRKVIRYLQDQAQEQSTTKQYLTPPGKEPQQRRSHPANSQQVTRNLSEVSTAVEHHRQARSAADGGIPHPGMSSRGSSFMHGIKRVQYAHENLLQSYEVYIPEPSTQQANDDKYWIIYIHGGYFRDPKVDATSFRPALEVLAESSPVIAEETEAESESQQSADHNTDFFSIQHNIAGFASINYRLSPHAGYPQDPKTIPRYELREAQWPDQIDDILAALRHLQTKYNFGSQYILSGHSVGAELVFLATLKVKDAGLPSPKCVIGCNGIYDFPEIHKTNPDYESITRNAMKSEFYKEASPALYAIDDYTKLVEQGTTKFVLSHSRDDGLVVWEQVEIMQRILDQANEASGAKGKVMLVETKGSHNALWEEGKPLAMVIRDGLNLVLS